MIPRLQVEVSIPRACYDACHDYHGVTRLLRAMGVFPVQAQEMRWKMDPLNPGGYVVTYSVPVVLAQEVTRATG